MAGESTQLQANSVAAAMLEDGAFLIAGLADGIPDIVEVLPNGDRSLVWNAPTVSWPLARQSDGARSAFAAVFPLPARHRGAFASVTLVLPGRPVSLPLEKRAGGLPAVLRAIAEEAGPALNAVADGLVEMLLGENAGPARARATAALLSLVAKPSGYVEIIGAAAGDEVFVQGWSNDLPAGRVRVLSMSEPALVTELACATYERADLSSRGSGFVGIVEAASLSEPESLKKLFYRVDDGWRVLETYERRTMLAARDVPGHLRGSLAQATAPQDVLARLRRTAHRFDGRETVTQARQPLRVGVDLVVHAEGSGVLVAGWLLDPRNCVREVRLVAGAQSVTISNDWTRLARDDVGRAYATDPQFQGLSLGRIPPGFIAFAPRIAEAGADMHLAFDLGDSEPPVHFPLTLSQLPVRQALARLFAAIDMRTAAGSSAIERQFGPLLRAWEPQRLASEGYDVGQAAAFADADVAIVIGADESVAEMISVLPVLACDSGTRSVPIVLAAPRDALASVAGDLARLTQFYGLSLRVVATEPGADVFDALLEGAGATNAPTLALLSGEVLPRRPGWLGALLAAYRAGGGRTLVSPTILFEDGSVRWAGAWLDESGERKRVAMPHAGFPADSVARREAQETLSGTLECCVVARDAITALGPAAGYLGAAAKNLDLALRIRQAGTPSLWLPDVEMIAAGDVSAGFGLDFSRRIDRWSLDHRWSLALANLSR